MFMWRLGVYIGKQKFRAVLHEVLALACYDVRCQGTEVEL